jgi:chromosome segregation ATPase
MVELIKKKIEYLLKILQQGENKNNNLSTLVETAIEVIKENQKKLKSFKISNETKEIKTMISELEEQTVPLTDEQFNSLLLGSLDAVKKIEDEKILKGINKDEYNKVMSELLELSKSQKQTSKETNISKIVETAVDIITHNNIISKNNQYIADTQQKFKDIKNKFKEIIKKLIQMNKDRQKDNTKALLSTAIDIVSQSKSLPQQSQQQIERIIRDDKKDDNNTKALLGLAVDIVSQSKPIPQLNIGDAKKEDELEPISQQQEIKSDNKKEEEKNIQTKLSSILRKFNSEYILFDKLLKDNISEINEKKNAEINIFKENYENQLKTMNKTITELESEIQNYEEQDENSWNYVEKQLEEIKKLNSINEENEKKIKELETQQLGNENEIQKLNNSIKEREQQIEFGNNRIKYLDNRMKKVTNDNTINIEEKNKQIQNLEGEISKKNETEKILINNLKKQFEEKKRFETENEGLQQQIGNLNTEIENRTQEIEDLTGEIEKNKEQFEKEKKSLTDMMASKIDIMSNQEKTFEKQMNEKIDKIKNMKLEIGDLKGEIKNKDKLLLNVIKKVVDFLPDLQDDINKLDVFFPEIAKMKNILQGIKSKTDCHGSDNLIGKIDNECLYFDKDTNKIESKSNEDNVLDALIEENKKIREQYREKIGIIKTLHSSKLREIEELKNSNKVQEEEEGELPYISG